MSAQMSYIKLSFGTVMELISSISVPSARTLITVINLIPFRVVFYTTSFAKKICSLCLFDNLKTLERLNISETVHSSPSRILYSLGLLTPILSAMNVFVIPLLVIASFNKSLLVISFTPPLKVVCHATKSILSCGCITVNL